MTTFRDTVVSDVALIELQDSVALDLKDSPGAVEALISDSSNSVTIFGSEHLMPIAIVGLIETHEGCGRLWALIAKDLGNQGFKLTSRCRALIDWVQNERKLHRIDMMVLADNRRHRLWALRLGFQVEGTARQYSPNKEDYLMMSRVWP